MALTDTACRNAKPEARLRKLSDGGGLQLWIQPNGTKLWRLAYRFGGKQKLLALGTYPTVTLAEARDASADAKRELRRGVDPSEARKEKRVAQAATKDTFNQLCDEHIAKLREAGRTEKTIAKVEWLLDFARPSLGDRPIAEIKPKDVLEVLQGMEKRGLYHSAHRLRSTIGAAYRPAIVAERADRDPTIALQDALVPYKETELPAIVEKEPFGALLRSIHHYDDGGKATTRIALELQSHVFLRPGELRQGEWEEIRWHAREWKVPADRMKGRIEHFVPLSRQVIVLLKDLHELTGHQRFLFPQLGRADRCMSENTLNAALRGLGYDTQTQHCAHGFRSSASTLLNESKKFHADAIERQLAHVDEDEVRRKYARGRFWEERVEMMQFWSDYLDTLRGDVPVLRLVKA